MYIHRDLEAKIKPFLNRKEAIAIVGPRQAGKTTSKAEVDFVIQYKDGICPIEIKYSSQKTIGKSYYSFLNKFKPKTGVILTKDYLGEEKIGATNVKFIPLCYL